MNTHLCNSWDAQLAGFLGITASAGAKALSHTISFAMILAITTNLSQYAFWKTSQRR